MSERRHEWTDPGTRDRFWIDSSSGEVCARWKMTEAGGQFAIRAYAAHLASELDKARRERDEARAANADLWHSVVEVVYDKYPALKDPSE